VLGGAAAQSPQTIEQENKTMSEPFLGQIQTFGFNFAPRGWSECNGQLLSISQNSALFSLLGTTFGGDGRTTFGLPDLRGRTPVHVGTGPGLTNVSWGERSGTENNTFSKDNLPARAAFSGAGNSSSPIGNVLAVAEDGDRNGVNLYSDQTPNVVMSGGGTLTVNNMQPYIGLYHSIALVGIFPSRN
jgi:microcystin-dependent protein